MYRDVSCSIVRETGASFCNVIRLHSLYVGWCGRYKCVRMGLGLAATIQGEFGSSLQGESDWCFPSMLFNCRA